MLSKALHELETEDKIIFVPGTGCYRVKTFGDVRGKHVTSGGKIVDQRSSPEDFSVLTDFLAR